MMTMIQLTSTAARKRRDLWLRIFGADAIPVLHPVPYESCTPDGRVHKVYDVDLRAMGDEVINRLANHMAATTWKTSYIDALERIHTYGYQVSANDVEIVEAEAANPAASVSFWPGHVVSHSPRIDMTTQKHTINNWLIRPLPLVG